MLNSNLESSTSVKSLPVQPPTPRVSSRMSSGAKAGGSPQGKDFNQPNCWVREYVHRISVYYVNVNKFIIIYIMLGVVGMYLRSYFYHVIFIHVFTYVLSFYMFA